MLVGGKGSPDIFSFLPEAKNVYVAACSVLGLDHFNVCFKVLFLFFLSHGSFVAGD